MHILFFDTDHALEQHAEKNPIKKAKSNFIKKSINDTPDSHFKDYHDVEIISIFTHSECVLTEKLDLLPNLKLIATRSTGFNHIDLDYCKKRGIVVSNVPRYGEVTVAEFAMGLLLSLSRKIVKAHADMAEGHIRMNDYIGFDLFGKTIGIVGTGSIGAHMIKLAQGFGMNVIAYDLYPKKELKNLYVNSLDELYQNADVISLHVPSTPENVHMLDEKAFEKMKRGVVIINTARGDLIDTQALYKALKSGHVAAAGLDVLENEDFLIHDEIAMSSKNYNPEFLLDSAVNFKLLQLKNVIATPHVAFNTVDAINRIMDISHENVTSFIAGSPLNNVVK